MKNFKKGRSIILSRKTVKICLVILFASVFLFYFPVFPQKSIVILQPKDKIITHKERLLLRGKAPFTSEITINRLKVGIRPDGMFSAGLILHPGKNLIEVKAKSDGKEIGKKVRILRVIKFPDMESLYKGRKHWARKDVISMSTLGIVEGYPDNTFKPKKRISREELATWIARAKDLIVKDLVEDVFFDIPKEHWRAPFVRAVIDVGYMKGSTTTTFGVGRDIKRGKAAEVIDKVESLTIPKTISKSPFSDVSVKHPYAKAIYAAFHGKMVIGVSKVRRIYQPNREMNRAEATILISRIKNVRQRLKSLYNFGEGYDSSKFSKINTSPVISRASVTPSTISTSSRLPLTFAVKVEDLQGLGDISEVKIDLTPIGGPPNAKMYDDGAHNDEKANDGMYALKVAIQSGIREGVKILKVFATDKSGWSGTKKIRLDVK